MAPYLRILLFCVSLLLSSCLYKMPPEDEMNTIPTTNNPNVTRDSSGPQQLPVPGISY
jgi:hypothetical protein